MLESERAPAAAAGEEEGRKEEERGEKEANYQGESFRVEGASLGSIMMKPDSSSPFQAGGGRGAAPWNLDAPYKGLKPERHFQEKD